MKSNWLFGAVIGVLLAAGYLATAQDPAGGQQPPPPPGNQPPPATERRVPSEGVQVEGQVRSDRASARPTAFHRAKHILGTKVSIKAGWRSAPSKTSSSATTA